MAITGKGFLLCLFLAASLVVSTGFTSSQNQKTALFVGTAKCPDCRTASLKGIHVRVMCRSRTSHRLYRSRVHGLGEFDPKGKFTLRLPATLLKEDGTGLIRKCYAQLYSTSKKAPCPTERNNLDRFRLVLTSKYKSVHVFGVPTGTFNFSRNACDVKNWNKPFYGFRRPHPIYVTQPGAPIYAYAPPVAPIYMPPAAPAYVEPAPVYTYAPPVAPIYMPPAAPIYTPPAAPIYTPPAAPIYTPPQDPLYTTMPGVGVPAAPIYAQPANPIYTQPADPVYTTMPGIGFPFFRRFRQRRPFPFQNSKHKADAGDTTGEDVKAIRH